MRTREGGREQFCVGRGDEREMVRGALEANSFQNLVEFILNCLLFLHIEFKALNHIGCVYRAFLLRS